MRFNVLSDLHLRNGPFDAWDELEHGERESSVMLLAGDIGNACDPELFAFLERLTACPRFSHVILVKGNHEAFGSTVRETDVTLMRFADRLPKLVYLNRGWFDVPGSDIRVAGCTLWTHVSPMQQSRVIAEVGDFTHIREWSLKKRHTEHERDVDFIVDAMGSAVRDNKRVVLITHHAPIEHIGSGPAHQVGPYTSSFECDLTYMLVSPIVAVVFGHTHFSVDTTLANGVRCVSNQKGKVDDIHNTWYRPDFSFEI